MNRPEVTGYSTVQMALHWCVVVLVAFQFLAHSGIEQAWRAFRQGQAAPVDTFLLTYLHVATGLLIFALMLARLYARLVRGVPPPPADEPRIFQIASEAVHVSIYLLLLLLPISGGIAWFFGVEVAGDVHEFLQDLLLVAIALHIAGALFQHFVRRSDVLIRMFRPQRS